MSNNPNLASTLWSTQIHQTTTTLVEHLYSIGHVQSMSSNTNRTAGKYSDQSVHDRFLYTIATWNFWEGPATSSENILVDLGCTCFLIAIELCTCTKHLHMETYAELVMVVDGGVSLRPIYIRPRPTYGEICGQINFHKSKYHTAFFNSDSGKRMHSLSESEIISSAARHIYTRNIG